MKAKLEQIQGIPGPTDSDVGKSLTYKGGDSFEWSQNATQTPATADVAGVVKFASIPEALAGTSESKAVPPTALAAAISIEASARDGAIRAALQSLASSPGSGVTSEYVGNLLAGESAARSDAINTAVSGEANARSTAIANAIAAAKAYVDTRLLEYQLVSGTVGAVSSVAGKTGAVTIASTDITDGTGPGRTLFTAGTTAIQRTALGLGGAATLAVGTAANTVAAGNDTRFANAAVHAADKLNPHSVTAAQVGAYSKSEADNLETAVRSWVVSYVASQLSNLQVAQQTTFPGPFADDAAAATGNVPLNSAYRSTSGVILWRQV